MSKILITHVEIKDILYSGKLWRMARNDKFAEKTFVDRLAPLIMSGYGHQFSRRKLSLIAPNHEIRKCFLPRMFPAIWYNYRGEVTLPLFVLKS